MATRRRSSGTALLRTAPRWAIGWRPGTTASCTTRGATHRSRPFWRFGVGDTHFDFTTNEGLRHDEWLFTSPFGIGIKYPFRRWLAGRIEFTDQFSWGGHGVATQHNLVLQFGLEVRFGGNRKAYWPWNPDNHIW